MLPITKENLDATVNRLGIIDINTATIRQICSLAAALEDLSGEHFVHLEIGNPGLPPEQIGIAAEKDALDSGVANKYPNINGVKLLKDAGSRFVKAFINLDVNPKGIVPVVGSMQGSFTMMELLKFRDPKRDTMLFIMPGFPAQRCQAKVIGMNIEAFDIYDYRGPKLQDKLEEILKSGRVSGIIYSNPNNPAWTNLTEDELKIIGTMASKYDAVVIEDLAYMGMDFRTYTGCPFEGPYVPTVGRYTDNYVLMVSSSKIFSYAGQRIAFVAISDKLYDRHFQHMCDFFEMPNFGDCYIYGILYVASSGTSHAAQYAMAAMLDAACDRKLDFVNNCKEYGRRAEIMKKMFLDNGFNLTYSEDAGKPLADGFFFTASYDHMTGEELHLELMRYGIASIPLYSTGSVQNGVRVCVSAVSTDEEMAKLKERLEAFSKDHKK